MVMALGVAPPTSDKKIYRRGGLHIAWQSSNGIVLQSVNQMMQSLGRARRGLHSRICLVCMLVLQQAHSTCATPSVML